MTFDDAIQEIYDLAVLKEYQTLEEDTWWNSNSQVVNLLEELRETYAPTIEMTELQKHQLLAFKEIQAGFSTFMFKQGAGEVPAFEDFITTDREAELMYAWLHPETITLID